MTQFVQYNPAASRPKKRPRIPQANVTPPDNPAKRPRFSTTRNTMITTPISCEPTNIHARLNPSARMDLALKVLDIGGLSITGLLMHRLNTSDTCHFEKAFLSEGGGFEILLKELVEGYPAAGDCIFRVAGHSLVLKKVSAEMEAVKSYTLLSSTDITPHSMRDWTIGIPEDLVPCLSSILHASAVSDRPVKENKVQKDTFTVSTALLSMAAKMQTDPSIDYQCHHSPTRKLSLPELAAISSLVWSLTPCTWHTSRGHQYTEQITPFSLF